MKLTKKQINDVIEQIKNSPIDGCITGSCMLEDNFKGWNTVPDIDIFCYSAESMIAAIEYVRYAMGFEFGNKKEDKDSVAQQVWKYQKLKKSGISRKWEVSTIYLTKDDVTINISTKRGKDFSGNKYFLTSVDQILASFDISIIMVGWDIQKKFKLDLRRVVGGTRTKAVLNPLRDWDVTPWGAEYWSRQWTRVIKYWERGYDTRPAAYQYLKMMDEVIALPNLFKKDESEDDLWEESIEALRPIRKQIADWIEEVKDL